MKNRFNFIPSPPLVKTDMIAAEIVIVTVCAAYVATLVWWFW